MKICITIATHNFPLLLCACYENSCSLLAMMTPINYSTLKTKWNELELKLPSRLKLKEIQHPHRHEKTLPVQPDAKFGAVDVTLMVMGVLFVSCALYIVLHTILLKFNHK